MRVIGGKLKGKTIMPPKGYKARPTTDFAKEGLFNILDNEYEFDDLRVLDLFGGAGSISIEFASRGASHVDAVEMNSENAAFISRTVSSLGLSSIVSVVHCNVFDFLPLCNVKYDIVFADPPYNLDGLDKLPEKVLDAGILHPGCYFILEHPAEYSFEGCPCFVKTRKYGNVHFSFFESSLQTVCEAVR